MQKWQLQKKWKLQGVWKEFFYQETSQYNINSINIINTNTTQDHKPDFKPNRNQLDVG